MKNSLKNKRPLLVTGAHRSGSTWVGSVLEKSAEIYSIFEPFNKDFGPGACRSIFKYWYPYIDDTNCAEAQTVIQSLLDYKFQFFKEILSAHTRWQLRQCLEQCVMFRLARWRKKRTLFKDPIALFSAPWLAGAFHFQVIVLVRHPAAFISSLKQLGWSFPFRDLLAQPLLMDGPLAEFRPSVEKFAAEPQDIIGQGILLWNIFYSRVREYQEKYPDWQILRHEDISMEPVEAFRRIFAALDLEFAPAVEAYILESSDSSNPGDSPHGKATMLKRDSRKNIYNWKKRLTSNEIDRILQGMGAAFQFFYPESHWSS